MKRRSLIGPLLLIAIGALFLLNNVRPDLVSFELVARYWPFVLIAWGVIRLVEIAVWRMSGKPLPHSGLSGGEWVLVVFICLIGSCIFVAHRFGPRLPPVFIGARSVDLFGEAYDYTLPDQKQECKASRVVVENPRGNTRIVGEDAQEIRVGGRKSIRAYKQSDADEADKKTPVEIIPRGDEILVRVSQQNVSGEQRVSADLELSVPRGASIRASGRYGDFDVVNVNGDVEIESANAGVRAQDLGGKLRVDLRKSDIVRAVNVKGAVEILGSGRDIELERIGGEVTMNGYFSGDLQLRELAKPLKFESGQTDLRFEKLPGQVHMDLSAFTANNIVGPVRLSAKSRDVEIEDFANSLAISLERGDVTLKSKQGPSAEVAATTRNGDIDLTLPPSAHFDLDATAERGEITNEYGAGLEESKPAGRGAVLKGAVGKGPKIIIKTERGSVTVRKG